MVFSIVCLHTHLYLLFAYSGFPSVFLTIMPNIFAEVYNEAPGIAGLHYIALGIGLSIASQLNARFLDRIYIYYKNKKGGVGQPEFRLRELLYFSFPQADAVLIIYSLLPSYNGPCKYCPSLWIDAFRMGGTTSLALDSNRHRALILKVVEISRSKHFRAFQGIACIGGGMIVSFQAIQTYVIDAFTLHAASGRTLSSIISLVTDSNYIFFFI